MMGATSRRRKRTPGLAGLALVLVFGLAASGSDLIFSDGFEGCSLSAWLGGSSGDAQAGGPLVLLATFGRFSGLCAMRASSGFVTDPSPADEPRMITRFYFLPSGSGSAIIYRTYDSDAATSPVYTVTYSLGAVTVSDNVGGGSTGPLPVNAGSWNSVEIDWDVGRIFDVWVNADATSNPPTASASAGLSLISSARLGSQSPSGSPTFLFDAYVARRTTAIGLLPAGDADGNGLIQVADAGLIEDEARGKTVNSGQPDCDLSGAVTLTDVNCLGFDLFPTAGNDSGSGYQTDEDTPFTTGNVLDNDTFGNPPVSISAFDATSAGGGTVTDNGDGTFDYSPAPDFNGSDSFGYTISDTDGDQDSATVELIVTAQDDPAIALDDSGAGFSTNEDTAFTTADVLANDAGDAPLAVSAFDAASAGGGTVTNNGDGTFDYTPAPDFNGMDSFGYSILDGDGDGDTAMVTVDVAPVNDPPFFLITGDLSATEGDPLQTVPDFITGAHPGAPDELDPLTIAITGNDNPLLFDLPPAISNFDAQAGTGDLVFTPSDATPGGTAVITVTLSDGSPDTFSRQFALTIVDADTANPPFLQPATFELPPGAQDNDVLGQLSFSDPDGDIPAQGAFAIIDGNAAGAFAVNDAGQILVADIDMAGTTNVNLLVRITDATGLSDQALVVISIDPLVNQPAPPPADSAAADRLGQAVAADGNLFAAGRPGARGGSGEVLVYRIEGTQLILDAAIPVPPGRSAINFGGTLDLEGRRLIVGAPGTPLIPAKGDLEALQAAIFERTREGWHLTAEFKSSQDDDGFADSVALDGDVAVVGAPEDDDVGPSSGAAYVFRLDDGENVVEMRKISPTNPVENGRFGDSVAASGGKLAIGAPGGPIGAALGGTVHLFEQIGDNLGDLAGRGAMESSGSEPGDEFGSAIALDGGMLVVGAPGEDGAGEDTGAVYVLDPEAFVETSRLLPDAPQDNAGVGSSVGTAAGEIAVGSPGLNAGAGAVFRFGRDRAQVAMIEAPPGQVGFGASVALTETALASGAPETENETGAAFLSRSLQRLFRSSFE